MFSKEDGYECFSIDENNIIRFTALMRTVTRDIRREGM